MSAFFHAWTVIMLMVSWGGCGIMTDREINRLFNIPHRGTIETILSAWAGGYLILIYWFLVYRKQRSQ